MKPKTFRAPPVGSVSNGRLQDNPVLALDENLLLLHAP